MLKIMKYLVPVVLVNQLFADVNFSENKTSEAISDSKDISTVTTTKDKTGDLTINKGLTTQFQKIGTESLKVNNIIINENASLNNKDNKSKEANIFSENITLNSGASLLSHKISSNNLTLNNASIKGNDAGTESVDNNKTKILQRSGQSLDITNLVSTGNSKIENFGNLDKAFEKVQINGQTGNKASLTLNKSVFKADNLEMQNATLTSKVDAEFANAGLNGDVSDMGFGRIIVSSAKLNNSNIDSNELIIHGTNSKQYTLMAIDGSTINVNKIATGDGVSNIELKNNSKIDTKDSIQLSGNMKLENSSVTFGAGSSSVNNLSLDSKSYALVNGALTVNGTANIAVNISENNNFSTQSGYINSTGNISLNALKISAENSKTQEVFTKWLGTTNRKDVKALVLQNNFLKAGVNSSITIKDKKIDDNYFKKDKVMAYQNINATTTQEVLLANEKIDSDFTFFDFYLAKDGANGKNTDLKLVADYNKDGLLNLIKEPEKVVQTPQLPSEKNEEKLAIESKENLQVQNNNINRSEKVQNKIPNKSQNNTNLKNNTNTQNNLNNIETLALKIGQNPNSKINNAFLNKPKKQEAIKTLKKMLPVGTDNSVFNSTVEIGGMLDSITTQSLTLKTAMDKISGVKLASISDFMNLFQDNGYSIYAKALYQNISQDTSSLISGYSANSGGMIAGLNNQISDYFAIGASLSYVYTAINYKDTLDGNQVIINSAPIKLAFMYENNFYTQGVLGFTYHHMNTNRLVNTSILQDNASALRHAFEGNASLEGGYKIKLFAPYVRLSYFGLNEANYKEKGNLINLIVANRFNNSLFGSLGIQYKQNIQDKFAILSRLEGFYDFLQGSVQTNASFDDGVSFITIDKKSYKVGLNYQIQLLYKINNNNNINLGYNLGLRYKLASNGINLKYSYAF